MSETEVRALAYKWARFMQMDIPFDLQYGSFDGLPEEAKAQGDEFGATFGSPGNDRFMVCISDKCPEGKLESVIVHELVHVHTFAQAGNDPREAMEVATELTAQLVVQLESLWHLNASLVADLTDDELNDLLNSYHKPSGTRRAFIQILVNRKRNATDKPQGDD